MPQSLTKCVIFIQVDLGVFFVLCFFSYPVAVGELETAGQGSCFQDQKLFIYGTNLSWKYLTNVP